MSDSRKNRKSDTHTDTTLSADKETTPGWLDSVPARLWYPIGFVGFFFAIGAWNQLASTWPKVTGNPIPGAGSPVGVLVGILVLFACTAMGLRQWWQERSTRKDSRSRNWKNELTGPDDDIRFP